MASDDRDTDSAAHNPPHEDDQIERRIAGQPSVAPNRWARRAFMLVIALVVAYVAYQISAAFFPRWWAQRVADQVQGRFFAGTTWGLFYGFVFTFVPLLLLTQVRRRFLSWTWRAVLALVAVVLAAPNWLTLSVVVGDSRASQAGSRIMDVDAPNFRASSLIGAVVAVVLVAIMTAASVRLRQRKAENTRLKGERDELRQSQRDS